MVGPSSKPWRFCGIACVSIVCSWLESLPNMDQNVGFMYNKVETCSVWLLNYMDTYRWSGMWLGVDLRMDMRKAWLGGEGSMRFFDEFEILTFIDVKNVQSSSKSYIEYGYMHDLEFRFISHCLNCVFFNLKRSGFRAKSVCLSATYLRGFQSS